MSIVIALGISVVIALLAGWRGSLSRSGVMAAVPVGTLILGLGGWGWGVPLFVFFVTSSGWSHFRREAKREAEQAFAKGSARDWAQVLANGGMGAALAVCHDVIPSADWYWFYLGIMASVTADTWGTELGTLSRGLPRFVLSGRQVPRGTSGAVSPLGTVAGAAGAWLIGISAAFFTDTHLWLVVLITGVSGVVGTLADSFLGATVQARFQCAGCDRQVETKQHCGQSATPTCGWAWVNNDLVNVTASVVGGAAAVLLFRLLVE